jgi:hypothetical protein
VHHGGVNSLGSTLTELEPSQKDYRAPTIEQAGDSPGNPETPAVGSDNVRREDRHCGGDRDVEVSGGWSFIRDRPNNEHDTGFVERNNLQRTDQTEEAPVSTAESSDQNLSGVTASTSSLPGLAPETDVSCTQMDPVVTPSNQHKALMRPCPFAFVFDGQPPAKRRRRASSATSSARPGEVWTPLVVASPHDAGLYTDLKREMLDNQEWQAQRIIGERQTPSGLEYEVSVEKTLWLPRAALDVKLVRRFRAGQRAATRVRTRWSSRLQTAGSLVRQ